MLAAVIIVLAAAAAYHNSFSTPFVFDDPSAIVDNPTIRPPWSLGALLAPPAEATVGGRPLVNLTLALNYAIGGTDVAGYHALNLLIHILAGLTLFGVVRRTLLAKWSRGQGARDRVPKAGSQISQNPHALPLLPAPCPLPLDKDATLVAFAIALLWTLHPLQTEAVTYTVQRTESLMGLFYLLTLYCFIRAAEGTHKVEGAGGREQGTANAGSARQSLAPLPLAPCPLPLPSAFMWSSLSILCCLLGMASKEVMVSAPVMVLLYDRTFVAGTFREAWRRHRRVYLGLAATWLLLGGLVASIGGNRGGTSGPGSGASFGAYALTQAPAVITYLRLSLWPHPLVFDYGAEWVKDWADVFLPGVTVVLLVAGTVWALVRRPVLGFLGAWFFSILAPTSLVPGPRQTMADHRMYLALAAVISLVAVAVYGWGGRRTLIAWLAVAAGFGWLTASRNVDYRSELSIWGDTAAKRPNNRWAQCNVGMALCDQGRPEEALPHLERGLKLDPGDPVIHNDLGLALAKLGRLSEAVAQYETALRLRPTLAGAHNNLGVALTEMDRAAEALPHLETALRLEPGLPTVYFNLGNTLARLGRTEEAIARYRQAIRQNPRDAAARTNLGNVLVQTGQVLEAIRMLEAATDLDPDDLTAQYNLATMLARVGRTSDAIAHFQAVLRLRPGDAQARDALMQLQASR